MRRLARHLFTLCSAVSLLLCLTTCYGCGDDRQRLPGGYVLERFSENGMYYVDRGTLKSSGGTFEGTIEQIGWTEEWILAKVTRIYRGDPDGWYALEVGTGRISGPLAEGYIASDPALRVIRTHSPGSN